jgi:hypothetical protein
LDLQELALSHFDLKSMLLDIDEAHTVIPALPVRSLFGELDHPQCFRLKPDTATHFDGDYVETASFTPLSQSIQASDTKHDNDDIVCPSTDSPTFSDNLRPQEIDMADLIIA